MRKRKTYTNEFKARVALDAVKELKTLNELASEYKVHPNQISKWKSQLLNNLSTVFSANKVNTNQNEIIDNLYRQIGEVTVERDWLKKKLWN